MLLSATWDETILVPSDPDRNQILGIWSAVDGDTAIVGRRDDAVVFVRSGTSWSPLPDALPYGGDNSSIVGDGRVGIFGNTAVVGTNVFERDSGPDPDDPLDDTWSLSATLTPAPFTPAGFPWGVAIHGDTIVVGAGQDDGGAAYVFERDTTNNTWPLKAKLIANPTGGYFGRSVDVAENIIIVGADNAQNNDGVRTGSAYIFQNSAGTWGTNCQLADPSDPASVVCQQNATLDNSGVLEGEQFGWHVAVGDTDGNGDTDTAVVGVHRSTSAYIFEGSGTNWTRVQTLTGSDESFGNKLAIDGDKLVAGAPKEGGQGGSGGNGAAYVFQRDAGTGNWGQVVRLTASDGSASKDDFGKSVAISGDIVVVGAPFASPNGPSSGRAYVFTAPQPGITITPTSGLVTTETGGSDTFDVVLDTAPIADVIIGISSDDPSEATVSTASVTFNTTNWDTPQTVTVTGVDDSVPDGDIAYTVITGAAISTDPDYNGLAVADVAVTNLDDDGPAEATMHVGDLDGSTRPIGKNKWKAEVAVTVHESPDENVLSGVVVDATWSGGFSGSATCTTDSTGQCTLASGNIDNGVTSVDLTIVNLTDTLTYVSSDNHDPDGDSDGTLITVPQGSGLRAAADAPRESLVGTELTEPMLGSAVNDGMALWTAFGVDPVRLSELSDVDVRIGDLSDSLLGLAYSDSIVIDRDAAGYGWSADGTAGMDILSAVVHEMGHLFGFDHDVMGSTLGVGVRDLGFLGELHGDSLSGTHIREPGDVNGDGRFDQWDLVAVARGDKYLTGQTADWTDGDWNGDGLFDQLDIVAALQTGKYLWASDNVTEVDAVFAQLNP